MGSETYNGVTKKPWNGSIPIQMPTNEMVSAMVSFRDNNFTTIHSMLFLLLFCLLPGDVSVGGRHGKQIRLVRLPFNGCGVLRGSKRNTPNLGHNFETWNGFVLFIGPSMFFSSSAPFKPEKRYPPSQTQTGHPFKHLSESEYGKSVQ